MSDAGTPSSFDALKAASPPVVVGAMRCELRSRIVKVGSASRFARAEEELWERRVERTGTEEEEEELMSGQRVENVGEDFVLRDARRCC
eukprot:2844130-Rhodomonas_salina.1